MSTLYEVRNNVYEEQGSFISTGKIRLGWHVPSSMLRPEHDTPRSSACQGFISWTGRIAATLLRRRGADEARAAMTFVAVFHAGEREARIGAEPSARRGCVVVEDSDLVVVENAIGSIGSAPPRIAEQRRERLDGDWTFVE